MNMYTNTKKTKKFILILVLLMLFNFVYPKQVKAIDFVGNISDFFFLLERGVITFLNNIFCDKEHNLDMDAGKVYLTPENIIKGKFILFSADIFSDISSSVNTTPSADPEKDEYYDRFDWLVGPDKARTALREVISGWYYSLFNFALVALLSVLVYVGIRMITSTISQDKAKYKTMLKDWLVAICLLIMMHYIMISMLNITRMITDAIGPDGGAGNQTGKVMTLIYNINKGGEDFQCSKGSVECRYEGDFDGDGTDNCYTISDAFAYELLLIAIILLTGLFAWKYMRREFTIIFLILLGPISCITYPIDKISDGKAQAFNKWFSEFLYNVLIQPFHLLLYLVLVGSAIELSDNNILYGLACLAMLIPAEKFVKEMFGFKDKLGSPLGAMATGAAAGQLLNKVKGGVANKIGGGGKGGAEPSTPPRKLEKRRVGVDDLSGPNGTGLPGPGDPNNSPSSLGSGGAENQEPSVPNIQDSPTLDDGDDNGGVGASAAAAFQNSSDPIRDSDREALEEDLINGDISQEDYDKKMALLEAKNSEADNKDGETGNVAGSESTSDTSENENSETENDDEVKIKDVDETEDTEDGEDENAEGNDTEAQLSKKDKVKSVGGKIIDRHSKRMAAKWGSTDRKQRWVNRGKKTARVLAKASVGFVGGSIGFMGGVVSGKGVGAALSGAVVGASTGSRLTDRAIDKVDSTLGNTIRDYADALKTPEQKEKKELKEFKSDKRQMDKAWLNYIDKNNGQEPSSAELDAEMEDRFILHRAGLSDDQIDDTVPLFQKLRDEKHLTEQQALSEAVFASQYADRYKGKFEKESDMKGVLEALTERLSTNGYEGDAELKAREILTHAAEMKKETIQLPKQRLTVAPPQTANTRQQVQIDVVEGETEISSGRRGSNRRHIDARFNYRENPNNARLYEDTQLPEEDVEYDVETDISGAGSDIKRISQKRTDQTPRKGRGRSRKGRREDKLETRDALGRDLDVKAAKRAIRDKSARQLNSDVRDVTGAESVTTDSKGDE